MDKVGSIFDRPAFSKAIAAGNTSQALVSTGVNGLCGVSVRESTGSAAVAVRIRDGGSGGAIIAIAGAPSSQVGSAHVPPQGVQVLNGALYLEYVSGSGEVVVWYG